MLDILHRIETKLDALIEAQKQQKREDEKMSAGLDQAYQALAAQVGANTSITSSAVDMITQLVQRLQAVLNTNTDDSSKVAALQQEISTMQSSATALANAIATGTAELAATSATTNTSGTTSGGSTSGTVTSGGAVTSGTVTSGGTSSSAP